MKTITKDQRTISDLYSIAMQLSGIPDGIRRSATPLLVDFDFPVAAREKLRSVLERADLLSQKLEAMKEIANEALNPKADPDGQHLFLVIGTYGDAQHRWASAVGASGAEEAEKKAPEFVQVVAVLGGDIEQVTIER